MNNYYDTLFPYAYNILGSADEAADAIQEVMLKYTQVKKEAINEKNYLIRSVINQSINRKKQLKRLTAVDELPQPITTFETNISAELKDLVSFSLLILLERLNPKERAVFILKEAFCYSHNEIAEVLSIATDNSRKIYSRAKNKVENINQVPSTKNKVNSNQLEKLNSFTDAIHSGNIEKLYSIFHEDIEFRADGGKNIQVVKKFLQGKDDVAKLCLFVYQKFHTSYSIKATSLNHQPALLYFDDKELRLCQIFEMDEKNEKIRSMNVILDPEKLTHINYG